MSKPTVPVTPLEFPGLPQADLSILRLDCLGAVVSGNKIFKLQGHFEQAETQGAQTLCSFGGPWSNHLHALAFAAKQRGLKSVGFIRGEQQDTAMLSDCQGWGMELRFFGFGEYRKRHDPEFCRQLLSGIPDAYLVPEGGGGEPGLLGCRNIPLLIKQEWDTLLLACGTGVTFAGIVAGAPAGKRVLGLPVLPAKNWMQHDVERLLETCQPVCQWQLVHGYELGGFARVSQELLDFIQLFEQQTDVLLDPVYTAKLFYAVPDLYRRGLLQPDEKVVLLHTGGLQGRRGFSLEWPGSANSTAGLKL